VASGRADAGTKEICWIPWAFVTEPEGACTRRSTLVSLFVAVAVAMMGIGIIAPILPLYAETFSASGLSIGLVFAAFSVSRAVFGPVVGRLSDRMGRRRILLVGLAGFSILSLLYVVVGNLWHLGVLRFVQGAASIMVTPIAQAYVGDITPRGKEGRMMNVFYSSMFIGVALGPLLGGWIGQRWSYEAAFVGMGMLSVLALVLVAWSVPPDHRKWRAKGREHGKIVPLRHILRSDAVRAISVYFASRGIWRQGMNAFYPLYAVGVLGFGEGSVGSVLSAYFLGGGLLQIPFGLLADRFRRFPQILIGSIGAPLLLLAVPFARSLTVVLILMFAVGALSALSRASVLAIRTELGRTHGMGTLAGLHGAAFSTGQTIGPPLYGVVADALGLFWVFPFGSAMGLLGSGLVIRWLRRWQRGLPAEEVGPRTAN
jgi:DHA1 family multidrug resistance protein-like MFS transporter